jgi:hypothetical protein
VQFHINASSAKCHAFHLQAETLLHTAFSRYLDGSA